MREARAGPRQRARASSCTGFYEGLLTGCFGGLRMKLEGSLQTKHSRDFGKLSEGII